MTRKRPLILAGLLGASLGIGSIAHAQVPLLHGDCFEDRCRNIPPGVQPALPGTYVNKMFKIQAAKAEMDDFVLYNHMWFKGGTELGPLGRYQLDLIMRRLSTVPFPVVIETSKEATIDAARREVIVALLQAAASPTPIGSSSPTRSPKGYTARNRFAFTTAS